MTGRFATLAAALLLTTAGNASAQPRPSPSPVEVQCQQEVARLFPPGSLSRRQNERERLVAACVANGGRMPG